MLGVGQRRTCCLAEPVIRIGIELARGMKRDARVAVQPLGVGQPVALLFPRGAHAGRVVARGALERVQRELAARCALSRRIRPSPTRATGSRSTAMNSLRGHPLVWRQLRGDALREPHIARLGREAKASPPIRGRKRSVADQRREQRLAGVGRRLAA